MINAQDANAIAQRAIEDSENAWLQLELAIKEAANKGSTCIIFKTDRWMYFPENCDTVKEKLEALGYEVSCQEYEESDFVYGTVYDVSW